MIIPIDCPGYLGPFILVCQEINLVINGLNAVESAVINGIIGTINVVNTNTINVGAKVIQAVNLSENRINNNILNSQNLIINRIVAANGQTNNLINQAQGAILDSVDNRSLQILGQLQSTENRLLGTINGGNDRIEGVIRSGNNVINSRIDTVINLEKDNYTKLADLISKAGQVNFDSVNRKIDETKGSIEATIGRGLFVTDAHIVALGGTILAALAAQTVELNAAIAAGSAATIAAVGASSAVDLIGNLSPDIISILGSLITGIGLVGSVKGDVENAAQRLNAIWIKLQRGQYQNYDTFINDLNGLGVAGSLTQTLWNIGKFLFVVTFGTLRSFEPFIENIVWLAKSQANSARLTPAEMLAAFHKIGMDTSQVRDYLKGLGYSDVDVKTLMDVSFTVVSPDVIKFLFLQGKIDDATHNELMHKIGYSAHTTGLIKQSYFGTPPVQDLITMAVREAFTPEIATQFGQYEGYPTVLTDYTRRWGIDENWSKAYWAAHWRLPSAEEGFEMLHRGIIGQDTLKLLLRALDIMPFWRDKVIDLSYSPLRLVDIRRFYADGVINVQQMFKEYKSRGYDDTHAQWATNWTILQASKGSDFEQANRRMLSQTVITKAFNAGKMSKDQAVNALMALDYTREDANLIIDLYTTQTALDNEKSVIDDNLNRIKKLASDGYGDRLFSRVEAQQILLDAGYTNNEVDLELDNVDYERDLKVKAHLIDWYRDLYTSFQIDRDTFIVSLGGYGFEANEIDRLLLEYDILRETRTRKPTFEQINKWWSTEIIDDATYLNELRGLGFDERYVTYFMLQKGIQQ